MQFKKDVSNYLVSLVNAPVYPLINKNKVYPAVVYSWRDGAAPVFYKDSFGLIEAELTVNIWSKSYSEMSDILESVVNGFNGYTGRQGQTFIQRSEVNNVFETTEDDSDLFRATLTIEIKI